MRTFLAILYTAVVLGVAAASFGGSAYIVVRYFLHPLIEYRFLIVNYIVITLCALGAIRDLAGMGVAGAARVSTTPGSTSPAGASAS